MASEQFSLCWDNFHKNMSSGLNALLETEELVDVTLAVEGKYLKAHKMVLSVCSPYFKELFKANPCQHPIVFMKDVSYVAISDLLQFMYQGEVQVSQDNLTTFIKTAEALQIKGLTGDGNGSADAESDSPDVKSTASSRQADSEYKPRVKKPVPAPISVPAPITTSKAPKRPRLSVSSNDSQSNPPASSIQTKTEPISTDTSSTPLQQFKVEPYDQNQSVTIPDDGDDNFGDDTLDDTTVDDTEDYSMMEGEETEPQAGTSADGTGEGQDVFAVVAVRSPSFHGGYSYGIFKTRRQYTPEGEKEKVILRCSLANSKGCAGKGYRMKDQGMESFVLLEEHNHPPDFKIQRRTEIMKVLREFAVTIPGRPIDVYNSVCSIYPDFEEIYPFFKAVRAINLARERTGFMRPVTSSGRPSKV